MKMHNNMQITKNTAKCSTGDMQQKAICHISGPARVLAGPGSGKTFTIIHRINHLVKEANIIPDKILCITFTKAAALEMQERYFKLEKQNGHLPENVQFGTIHSIGYHILKESGEFRQYSLIKESDKRKFLEIILLNKGLPEYATQGTISHILDAVGRKKNGLSYIQEELLEEECFEAIYKDYLGFLKERQLFDFDDMIANCLKLFENNIVLKRKWQERYSYLLVDEFQDINEVQYRLIQVLAAPQNNLFVVGDDDQSIYAFRGAAPGIMKQFESDYPQALLLQLTENHRSCQKIVSFSNKIIAQNIQRINKKSIAKKCGGEVSIIYRETRKAQELQIINDIKKLTEQELSKSALIVRTNSEVSQYISLLKTHKIKIREKQQKSKNLLCHFIREDFQAFLQFCQEKPKRSDFLKIMNKPEMYLARQALTKEEVYEPDLLQYYSRNPQMQEKIKILFKHFEYVREMSFFTSIRYFRNIIKYDDYLRKKAVNIREFEMFKETADELSELMKLQKSGEKCEAFFERLENLIIEGADVSLRPNSSEQDNNFAQGISVITMHSSKGLEFNHVFLPDVNEGVIPGKQCKVKESIEEERRLLYVAITRAEEFLSIYYTKERGRKPSRFLNGLIPHQ